MSGESRVARCSVVWGVVSLLAAALQSWLLPMQLAGPAHPGFVGWLVTGCGLAASLCVGWLWVLTTLVVVDAARGRSRERVGVPPVVRRLVLAACGLSLAGSLASPAHAERVHPAEPSRRPSAASTLLVGLPVPDRTTTTTQWVGLVARHRPADVPEPGRDVVVTTGDTLWDLAASTLPEAADDADIERRWQQIYRANREVVGADPDLIRPGQRLLLPDRQSRT